VSAAADRLADAALWVQPYGAHYLDCRCGACAPWLHVEPPAADTAGLIAARRLQRLERIGDAIEALIPAAAVVVAALLFVAMVLR
jgi:hypothetical protein